MRSLIAVSFAALLASQAVAGSQTFGKPLKGLPLTTLAAVLEKPEAGKSVALEGTIKAVCQARAAGSPSSRVRRACT